MDERVRTMENHLDGLFDAVEAVVQKDDAAFHRAMKEVEKAGDAPGAQDGGMLEAVHARAKELAKAPDGRARAQGVVDLLDQCRACHTTNGVSMRDGFTYETPARELLAALLWEDELRWAAAAKGFPGSEPLSAATTWSARRTAFVDALAR
ncbi:MAG: hypothetical protein KC656_02035 [Myxococcales bacterium]|nr:hypothetical protein [Myxococcales bacterium]